jgi:D-sedoheptulose 7-phosphate isomerase
MVSAAEHLDDLRDALARLEPSATAVERHGRRIGRALAAGARLLAVGNGGSAAQAEHLTAELVGRFDGERRPLAGIAIGAEYPSTTAIVNDYGPEDAFVRPVRAHGRQGDVLVALSTSGRSGNVLAAVAAAHEAGMTTLALTGRGPNPLAAACHDAITVDAARTATVQEVHQVLIHLLCIGIDAAVCALDRPVGAGRAS